MPNDPKQLLQQVAQWARSKGIPRPSTQDGMKALIAQYLQVQQTAQKLALQFAAEQPVWNEIPDDRVTHMVNDGATTQIVDTKPEGVFEDDWDRLMRDREAAAVGPNGELLDDFDQEFQLGVAKQAEAAATSPPTNTNPPSAVTAILGGQSTPNATQPPVEVARWVANTDTECTNFTVTAALVKPPQSIANGNISYHGYLIVQWGIRGYTFNMEVDIGQGVEFTLTGSFVSVQIAVESSIASNVGPPYTAGVSFREANRTSPLTRSKTLYTASSGATTSVNVPPFAKKYWVIPTTSADTVDVTVQEPDATTLMSFTQAANTGLTSPYILPPSAAFVNVKPSTSVPVTVIFELGV